ncbi:phosphotransferase [Asanoa ishikariensis]|uniref:Predicted kinase, aminoglycoside phosphotransferase (APT) family n=1 Tax=Asanoa ishikariensis TaxID=137265 RepID=A0A1H3RQJ4_9ACTN|nr:aminoglycoside phosphotransferase family protein [Asanoa ishikariensis]GIF67023.1 phosphotransferase [Asanoa ishikariensis]SDZ27159.1 Predicted kinase, aminoglycoside phosphotransferase (APT) family [Asanoa ishikariensis]
MHAGEFPISAELVAKLVAAQFPEWSGRPLTRVTSSGTVNVLFRLGDDLVVRLPRVDWSLGDIETEATWLPWLAPRLPVTIPTPVAAGAPGEGYPWPWAIYRWLPGAVPVEGRLADPLGLAADLAEFVKAMRAVDRVALPGSPPAAYRGGGHSLLDETARNALDGLGGQLDADTLAAAREAWAADLAVPDYAGPPVWLHADLMPGNLLVDPRGRLTAVIDFGTLGVGDPSCDLIVAWNLLTPEARAAFRAALDVDEPTWRRGRGRSLAMALGSLVYYHETNPPFADNARYVIREVLCDLSRSR